MSTLLPHPVLALTQLKGELRGVAMDLVTISDIFQLLERPGFLDPASISVPHLQAICDLIAQMKSLHEEMDGKLDNLLSTLEANDKRVSVGQIAAMFAASIRDFGKRGAGE